ncbi:MAG: hypothetical protein M1835_007629 [Candelina submexicana]|nr:MAG: hypothetical protein M1835_007629 [Candelina submexicana]
MPRTILPPTPASSMDIAGQDKPEFTPAEPSFALPPPALVATDHETPSSSSTQTSSESSYHPASPVSPAKSRGKQTPARRRSSGLQLPASKDDFTLPPPPTRSRKIIQMKPGPQQKIEADVDQTTPKLPVRKDTTAASGGAKRKQPGSTTAAGRKTARKTAHSLIERRRRSKMNEEFGVLKDMIPACKGQEMHKLSILQASIEYLRYLEQCVSGLKANSQAAPGPNAAQSYDRPPPSQPPLSASPPSATDDEDVEMKESQSPTSPTTGLLRQNTLSSIASTTSPALTSQRHYSFSSNSALASPAFGPHMGNTSSVQSTSTSPALLPLVDGLRNPDHEATAALLMLNTDRRNTRARGMSVKELLSG